MTNRWGFVTKNRTNQRQEFINMINKERRARYVRNGMRWANALTVGALVFLGYGMYTHDVPIMVVGGEFGVASLILQHWVVVTNDRG